MLADEKLIPLTARIIASTNQNLGELCEKGQFRSDLYFRLNIIEVKLPALRERPEDIPQLIESFCSKNDFHFRLDTDAMALLKAYEWPGNVRELRNLLIKMSIMSPEGTIHRENLLELLDHSRIRDIPAPSGSGRETSVPQVLELPDLSLKGTASEKSLIEKTLAYFHGNIKYSADYLKISRPTLYSKINKYEIVVPQKPAVWKK